MKFVKNVEAEPYKTGLYAIYKLSDAEAKLAGFRYLANQQYAEYALKEMKHIDLVEQAVRESEYMFSTCFGHSIQECELRFELGAYKWEVQQLRNSMRYHASKLIEEAKG